MWCKDYGKGDFSKLSTENRMKRKKRSEVLKQINAYRKQLKPSVY